MAVIDPEVRDKIQPYLRADEKLLWADKRDRRVLSIISIQIFLAVAFPGLFLIGFAILYIFLNGFEAYTWWWLIVPGVGVIFLYEGIKGLHQIRQSRKDIYAITDKRVISKFHKGRNENTTFSLRHGGATLIERKSIFGTGIFNITALPQPEEQATFNIICHVKNPDHVEKLLQKFIA